MSIIFKPSKELSKAINSESKEEQEEVVLPKGPESPVAQKETSLFDENEEDEFLSLADKSRTFGKELYSDIKPDENYQLDDMGDLHAKAYGSVVITPEGDIFGDYSDLRGFLQDTETTGPREKIIGGESTPTMEAHHLIHQEVLRQVGISSDEGPSVALWSDEHMRNIHANIGVPVEISSVDGLKEYYVESYNKLGLPEWSERVSNFVDQHRETIEQNYSSNKHTNNRRIL